MTSSRPTAQSLRRFDRTAAASMATRSLAGFALTLLALFASSCDAHPESHVVFDDRYPASATSPLVVYRAHWHSVTVVDPITPGASSDPQPVVPASGNTAYVVLAPGWDPASQTAPTALVVMQSRRPFEVALDDVLRIPVDDASFVGNCAAGNVLTQDQADFITRRVFAAEFASFHYDAATCTLTAVGDAGGDALDAGDARPDAATDAPGG